ncbi:Xaa-Pro peptidase family protein [Microbulbifer sp. CAU 1566]|uniref:M24 family metallopeptidase n=1 Tax=Microbulbifer sp. CAU 1566 TaxID=2933269 RepID=UPI002004D9AB|nr:Xaa-Pro peptidase family protein [Microbulbifer sp. CAU 1566]MCK7596717.1 Xaa-Pro peptidase family protein [Microbulbifer sp. CAU 1566]
MTRLQKLQKTFFGLGIDGMLITSMPNLRYLTGFASDEQGVASLLHAGDHAFLITDYRFGEQAQEQCAGKEMEIIVRDRAKESLGQTIQRLALGSGRARRLGFERDHISYSQWQAIAVDLALDPGGFKPLSGIVEKLRRKKEPSELEHMQKAARIADASLEQLLSKLRPGMTEREAAVALEHALMTSGSEGTAFPTIFASGPRSSRPHGMPSERQLRTGDMITIDFGAVIEGYRSDMTRTVVLGRASEQQREVYGLVKDAQKLGVDSVMAGIPCSEPATIVAEFLSKTPYARFAGDGLGHAIGLETHEKPYFTAGDDTIIEPGFVMTVEPGIYIPGWGGARIEDDIVVQAEGIEMLTQFPRDLIEIA